MQNPYIDHEVTPHIPKFRKEKLLSLIKKHKQLIIGVDYDNTIREFNSQDPYNDVIDLVKRAKTQGHIICIWTANIHQEEVKKDLTSLELTFDFFNESPICNQGRKPHFNLLLDDIAGLHESYHTLDQILKGQL